MYCTASVTARGVCCTSATWWKPSASTAPESRGPSSSARVTRPARRTKSSTSEKAIMSGVRLWRSFRHLSQRAGMHEQRPAKLAASDRSVGFEQVERPVEGEQHVQAVELGPGVRVQALGQVGQATVQRVGDFQQPREADAVGAALVLLDLLEGHADRGGQRLLREALRAASLADAMADRNIEAMRLADPGVCHGVHRQECARTLRLSNERGLWRPNCRIPGRSSASNGACYDFLPLQLFADRWAAVASPKADP